MEQLDVLVVLDRSGSMQDARADHEGGLKSFVDDQRQLAGDVKFTLIQFDSQNPCEVVYDRAPLDVVTRIELVPRAGTPLLDAIGKAVEHLSRHDLTNVVCMIITDGEENESREWTKDRIAARVKELEGKGWTFLFLGANIDAFAESKDMGFAAAAVMDFANNAIGTHALYAAASSNMATSRRLGAMGASASARKSAYTWTASQRAAAMGNKPKGAK